MTDPPPLQRGTSADTIAAALRDAIHAGRYRHGQQLPSTRALAQQWGTSVATVTRGMQLLVGEGIVVARDRAARVVNHPESALDPGQRVEDMDTEALADLVARGAAELARRASGS